VTPEPENPLFLPDGKLLLNGGDMVAVPSDCCCGGSENPCTWCSGRTPVSLQVLFSGLTICTACYVVGGGSYKFTTPPPAPVGPYTLAQTANACVYEYSAGVSGQIDMYATGDCTGASASFPLSDLKIQATFTANQLDVSAWWTHAAWGPMGFYGPDTYFFSATLNPTTVCNGPWTPANGLVACNTNGPAYMGHSGAASVVSKWT